MDSFVLAQVVGFLGYSVCAISPRFSARWKILFFEGVGFCITAVQWWMLDVVVALCMDSIAAYTAFVALLGIRFPRLLFLRKLSYPMLFVAALYAYEGTLVYFAAISQLACLMTAKQFSDMRYFRGFSFAGGVLWMLFAFLAGSIPSFIFGTAYAIGHAIHLWKYAKDSFISKWLLSGR